MTAGEDIRSFDLDLVKHIFFFLNVVEVVIVTRVCKLW